MSSWGKSWGNYWGVSWGTIVVTPGGLKVWLGTWQKKPLKMWNGTEWVVKNPKRWNGTSWVTLN